SWRGTGTCASWAAAAGPDRRTPPPRRGRARPTSAPPPGTRACTPRPPSPLPAPPGAPHAGAAPARRRVGSRRVWTGCACVARAVTGCCAGHALACCLACACVRACVRVQEALRLIKVATQTAAIDPRTGQIDMNRLITGHSGDEGEHVEQLVALLRERLGARA